MFPNLTELTICFAHVAYPMSAVFAQRDTGIEHFQIWDAAELPARIGAADVLVVSGFWDDALLAHASRLRFIQAIGAGYNQFPLQELQARGIRLASAQGVNQNAVSEHAMAQLLSFSRKLHTGRDHQRSRHWRAMISQIDQREDELGGKTLLIYGLGGIGARLSRLAKAFDMRVIGVKRTVANAAGACDEVVTPDRFAGLLPEVDYLALTCPLTPETHHLVNAQTLAAMKPSAILINMARGGCVDEAALIAALEQGQIAGAGLDVTEEEPLSTDSPLWAMENVILTPHTAGETQQYEENVIDILLENLGRLARGEQTLFNEIV